MIRTLPKPLHHADTHDAPAQRAHHFPEFDAARIDRDAARYMYDQKVQIMAAVVKLVSR